MTVSIHFSIREALVVPLRRQLYQAPVSKLVGICDSVWVLWLFMGWIPRWSSLWRVHPFVLAPNFVSVTPVMGILFHILRRNEISTRWSSFFLIFLCFAYCILGILSFWANIHFSVSAYQVTLFVIKLPHSGWCPPETSMCRRIS